MSTASPAPTRPASRRRPARLDLPPAAVVGPLALLLLPGIAAAQSTPGSIVSQQKISDLDGGLAPLADDDQFGAAVTSLGLFDGDAVVDVAVGVPRHDGGGLDRGAVRILTLKADGSVKAERTITTLSAGFGGALDDQDQFGAAVAAIGDLDGDGTTDLAVGAPGDDDAQTLQFNTGAVWILFLNADGTVRTHQKISELDGGLGVDLAPNDAFGSALAPIGDLDGDGTVDLAVGVPGDDQAAFSAGAVQVLFLNPNGTVKATQKITTGVGGFTHVLDNTDGFGNAVAGIHDLDGDGLGEVAVGAPYDDDGLGNAGAVYVLYLHPNGTVRATQKVSLASGGFTGALAAHSKFGRSITAVGDVDQDGVDDLAVGAEQVFDGGAVWVLFLDAAGQVKFQQEISRHAGDVAGLDTADMFGAGVANLGDTDGDGVDDLFVGASADDDGGVDRGAAYVVRLGGKWVDNGGAIPGVAGAPVLTGTGDLTPGSTVVIDLAGARPSAPLMLAIGLSRLNAPMCGGAFVPSPDVLLFGLMTDAAGGFTLPAAWPAGLPSDLTLYFQMWISDAAACQGHAASNGLSGTTP